MNLIKMIIRRIIQFKIQTFKILNLNTKMTIQFIIFLIGDLKIKNKIFWKKIKRINKKIMIKIKMTKKMRKRSLYILKFLFINQYPQINSKKMTSKFIFQMKTVEEEIMISIINI